MGKRRSSFVASDNSGDERPAKASKKAKNASSSKGEAEVDADGNAFWELSNKRRVVVSKFSGKLFVNIREYYEDKSGDMKPGKKGIMLSVEQYQALTGLIPAINAELRNKGVVLDGHDKAGEDDEHEEAKEEKTPVKPSKSASKTKTQAKKANIEATSDEDED